MMRTLLCMLVLALIMSSAQAAFCQDVELEPVVATAEKWEENPQKTPISMTYLSEGQIEDGGVRDAREMSRFIPNAYMGATGTENVLTIRGISSFDTALFSPAGFFVDGVSMPLHYMYNMDLLDVERVETLRGPQGTLYGRNNESGLIHVITQKPSDQLRAKVYGEYGSFNSYRVGGNVSGPIVKEKFQAGLALQQRNSDGFMENLYNNDDETAKKDSFTGRIALRAQPAPAWDINLNADLMETDDGLGVYRYMTGPNATDFNKINQDADLYSEQSGNGQTLSIDFKNEYVHVTSITGLRDYEHDFATDNDFSPMPFASADFSYQDDSFSQELRLASPDRHGPLKWLAGAYFFSEDTEVDYNRAANWHLVTNMETTGAAGFGQAVWSITDFLRLTGGLRFDSQDMDGAMHDLSNKTTFSESMDHEEWLPKISFSCDVAESAMIYASAAKGFLAGGYNYGMSRTASSFTYGPEYTWNYEAGLKATMFNGKCDFSLAGFYIDIDDKQVFDVDPAIFATEIRNAASAHSSGFEAEARVRPIHGLDIFGNIGWAESRFDDWTATEFNSTYTGLIKYDYEDKKLPSAPKYTGLLGAMYRHKTGLFLRGDVMFTGEFYADAKNTARQGAYELVNLRTGYEADHFDVVLWCENLFDQEYEKIKYAWGVNELAIDGAPRTVGVLIRLRV
ncbi:TonB-dependent receptor [Desulfatibacillum aliphaticivorans]|uniref:TonB-dependent receptor n=1 Tax=Desulfatibacillum aliphaticivorans TaxID=218208 RepID=UPI000419D7F6|nr:TonB-dependent receptor [Desulfatibacillum aliphaticivorans]